MLDIKFTKLHDNAHIPTYANIGDAGADLYNVEEFDLGPRSRHLAGTGIAVEIPEGYVGLIHPRSGLAVKYGITVVNAPGTVDSKYRGEIKVNLINLGWATANFLPGDRIAQIVFQKFESANFVEVISLETSVRGEKGHGSSGR